MADKKDAQENAEQTLITLEQLSQTLDVMTCVVDRLKQHLDRQMSLTRELFHDEEQLRRAINDDRQLKSEELQKNSCIVEITQQAMEEETGDKTLH